MGHKALAVNLSDLAACGAEPLAFTLALAMPRVDEAFLDGFARGLFALADAHGIELVGGDTTAGPLNICITVFGEVPAGQALLRSGARAGDDLWVSGTLGDARLALEAFRGTRVAGRATAFDAVRRRMEQPDAARRARRRRCAAWPASAIDLSDGLVGDLGHVLARSGVGATLDADASAAQRGAGRACRARCSTNARWPAATTTSCCSLRPPSQERAVSAAAARAGVAVTRIGRIEAAPGLRIVDGRGAPLERRFAAFDHFARRHERARHRRCQPLRR